MRGFNLYSKDNYGDTYCGKCKKKLDANKFSELKSHIFTCYNLGEFEDTDVPGIKKTGGIYFCDICGNYKAETMTGVERHMSSGECGTGTKKPVGVRYYHLMSKTFRENNPEIADQFDKISKE